MAKLPPEVSDAVAKILSRGPEQVLRDDERALGFEPLKPGDRPWFPASDWDHTNVISIRGKVVRIVAIIAVRKGEGAFSRLITGIAKEGLIPIVVAPMFGMPEILNKWGWKQTIVGKGWSRQELWQPSPEWLEQRRGK